MLLRWTSTAFAGFLLAAAATAQPPDTPVGSKFDTVSIRSVPPNSPPVMREQTFSAVQPGGQYVDSRANLFGMIAFAYEVEDPSIRLVGLPDWVRSQSYEVWAKPAEGSPTLSPAENREQVRRMLRAMLEDRFHLQLHTETRQGHVGFLEVAKGGFKIKEVDPPVPPEKAGFVNAAMGDEGGRIIGKRSTMSGMAHMLVIFLKRPVIDRTGLTGYHDFDVKWSAPESPDGQPARGFGAVGTGLLISALQEQFGLRLSEGSGP